MSTDPFESDHEDHGTRRPAIPDDPGELLDRYSPQSMPDPASVRVPDDPGELMDEDEDDEDEDPEGDLDDRDSYSM
ncbi:hypothetical protein [Actinospica robiniae]|uniref:hypothetical protein n=1 Tax=Actinospica robiniae TaxID=304901 RepID=UPI00040B3643|nr:hypothetical protein [Actinospica robiniae]